MEPNYIVTDGWEYIYAKKGEVQTKYLDKVLDGIKVFKKNKYINVLDLGCGTGRHTILLAEEGFNVHAIDISKTGIDILNNKISKLGISNVKTCISDMRMLPYENSSFDAVICVLTIDHGTTWQVKKTIEEIYRVLRSGGILIVDFMSEEDETFGLGVQIEENSFVSSMEDEEGICHHYTNKEELSKFFQQFSNKTITSNDYHYFDERGDEYIIKMLDVVAEK